MEVEEDSVGLDCDHSAFMSYEIHGAAVVDNNHGSDAHVSAKPKQEAADIFQRVAGEAAVPTEESSNCDQEDEDMPEKPPLSYELQQGFRILRELMADSNKSVNWPFVDRVDDTYPETADYYERIKRPMWLTRMEEKFDEREYSSITEFVADFRLMLENCYRFNGPDHHISKKGQRLETMLEQKLALLSRELRAKTTVAATSGKREDEDFLSSGLRRRPKTYIPHDSSALLNQLRNEEAQRERELRRQQIADRRAANEAAQKEILDWESNSLLAEPTKSHMMHSWELPQIGLFLYLLREPLNLGEIPQFELERCLAMSRQSATLQLIMTSLLSTPFQRLRIDKKKTMPYAVWTFKLTKKMDVWYKVLNDCQGDKTQAAIKLGLEARSFDVMGTRNPLRRRPFHKHSFYRKVWILKSLCDYCLETQETLRKFLEDSQPIEDQRELVLGSDAKGNLYIHFPQFCGADLRIYRQRKPKAPESSDDEDEETGSEHSKASSAKRQLKLGNQGTKNGRSSTPSRDSESESVPSPAPSSTKSRSQSRTSSPMPKESSGRTRQSGSRNTPSPHSTPQDSIFGVLSSGSKTRKTRNSAEASLLYNIMDLEAIGRRRSRRSKATPASDMEAVDNESSCSNIGEECSQDAVPSPFGSSALVPSTTSRHQGEDASDRIESNKSSCQVPVKSEFSRDCTNSNPVPVKEECRDEESHCDNSDLKCKSESDTVSRSSAVSGSLNASQHIKPEQSGDARFDVKETLADSQACTDNKEFKKESTNCDEETDSADIQRSSNSSTVQISSASESQSAKVDDASPRSGSRCDSTFAQKSNIETPKMDCEPSQQTSTSPPSGKELKADDSGCMPVGCGSASLKDSDDEACSEKKNDSSDDLKANVQAALIDHAAYSATTVEKDKKTARSQVKEEIIMEESDGEEEEMEPDLEDFELIVDSVKGLQDLVGQFADPPPPVVDTSSSRKGKKQRVWKPPQRKRCEVELHQRLTSMLNELTKWEQKLIQAASRMRTKMRREFDEYQEEVPQEEDTEVWDTEPEAESSDEEGNEDSQTGEDGEESEGCQSDALLSAAKKKKGPSSTPSTASESTENDRRDIEDYEMDVSSRGRLRKRRVIPNNVEDQGIKKKKVVKKPDVNGTPVTTSHVPNILQKSQSGKQLMYSYTFSPSGLGDSSALLASLTRQSGTGVLSLSASQLLAMAVSQGPAAAGNATVTATVKGQQQTPQGLVITPQGLLLKTTQASSQVATSAAGSTNPPASGSSKLNSHPEIQKLLSARRPLVVDSRHAPYKTVQLRDAGSTVTQQGSTVAATSASSVINSTSAASTTTSPSKAPLTPGAKGTGVAVSSGVMSTGQQASGGTMMLAMVGGKPQLLPASLVQQLMKAGNLRIQTTTSVAAVTNSIALTSQPGATHQAAITVRPVTRPQANVQAVATPGVQVVRPGSDLNLNRMQLNSLVLRPATPGQVVTPARIQGVAGVVSGVGGAPVSSSSLSTTPTTIAQVALLGSPGKQLQSRYAGNVTVKTLLENRAARKSSEEGDSSQNTEVAQSASPTTPPKDSASQGVTGAVSLPLSATGSPTSHAGGAVVGVVPAASLVARGVGMPGVVRLTSQSMLDLAVQTVVTTYHTTLPTADIKVPSPTALPSLSPKKNVTSVVMSTKAPIPITTRCESTSGSAALSRSLGSAAVAGGAVTALVQGSEAARPGVVLMTGGKDADPNSKNKVVLQMVPQGSVGGQTIVQGVMLSDGTIIPQGALTQTLQLQTAVRATQQALTSQPAVAELQSLGTQKAQTPAAATLSSSDPTLSAQLLQGQLASKAATNRATTDVLKSMLAAKAGTSIATIQQPGSSLTTIAATLPSPRASLDPNAAGILRGQVKVGASMPAAALVQQMAAIRGVQGALNPRIISTQIGTAQQRTPTQVQVPLGQLGKVVARQVQLPAGPRILGTQQQLVQQQQQQAVPSSAAGRVVMASSPPGVQISNQATVSAQGQATPQKAQSGTEQVMTMTLPPGLQLAAVPGSTALQLVSPTQLSAGPVGGGQPVVAAVRGGPQGLQQLRLLATREGTQKVHILTPQQQQALAVRQLASAALSGQGAASSQALTGQTASVAVGKGGGIGGGDAATQLQVLTGQQQLPQQQQVQLCFKVQPAGQVLASVSPATAAAQGVSQGRLPLPQPHGSGARPVLPRPQVNHTVSPRTPSTSNPSLEPVTVFSTVTNPLPATLPVRNNQSPAVAVQPLSNVNIPGKSGGQPTAQVSEAATSVTGKPAQVGRLQMTITPDPSTGQLTISPQHAPPLAEASKGQVKDVSGGQTGSVVTDAKQKQDPVLSPAGAKRVISDTSVQPIPVKMARLDTTSNLSGPVLANLSQVVGAKMNSNPVPATANRAATSNVVPVSMNTTVKHGSPADSDSQQAISQAQGSLGSPGTGCTSLATGTVLTDAAGTVSPKQAAHTMQAQTSMTQLLQQMQQTGTAAAVTTAAQSQDVNQQQQPVVMMRTVGGQLLTPFNIPVTVNNGVMKVLPKATFQVGNQMVTVLSPSNAMVQNLKSPTQTHSSSVGLSGSKSTAATSPQQDITLGQGGNVNDVVDGGQEDASGGVAPATTPAQLLQSEPLTVTVTSQAGGSVSPGQEESTMPVSPSSMLNKSATVGDTSIAGAGLVMDTPVLKARLQQPVNAEASNIPTSTTVSVTPLINGAGGEQLETPAVNSAAVVPEESAPSASGDASAHNGDDGQSASGKDDSGGGGGPDNLIEKEQAALSLLTFANQVPTD